MKFKFGFKSYTSSDSLSIRSGEQSTLASLKEKIEQKEKQKLKGQSK